MSADLPLRQVDRYSSVSAREEREAELGVKVSSQIMFNEVTHSWLRLDSARDESSAAGVHGRQVLCVPARHAQTVVA